MLLKNDVDKSHDESKQLLMNGKQSRIRFYVYFWHRFPENWCGNLSVQYCSTITLMRLVFIDAANDCGRETHYLLPPFQANITNSSCTSYSNHIHYQTYQDIFYFLLRAFSPFLWIWLLIVIALWELNISLYESFVVFTLCARI